MLAVNEVVNHSALDRAGPIQCIEGREVFNRGRFITPQDITHAMRFKLEHSGSQASVKDLLIGCLLAQGDSAHIYLLVASLLNEFDRIVENRQRGQPKKIHFEQAHLFNRDHVESSNDFVVLGPVQRDKFLKRPR